MNIQEEADALLADAPVGIDLEDEGRFMSIDLSKHALDGVALGTAIDDKLKEMKYYKLSEEQGADIYAVIEKMWYATSEQEIRIYLNELKALFSETRILLLIPR